MATKTVVLMNTASDVSHFGAGDGELDDNSTEDEHVIAAATGLQELDLKYAEVATEAASETLSVQALTMDDIIRAERRHCARPAQKTG